MPSAAKSDPDLSPESRPTLPPPVDIAELAEQSRRTTPSTAFVPLYVPTVPPANEVDDSTCLAPLDPSTIGDGAVTFDEAAILAHLDGASSIAEVANLLGRPRGEIRDALRSLAGRGLVRLALPSSPPPPPVTTTLTRLKSLPEE